MGTKNNPAPNDCYTNALPDEPIFTLLARDLDAPRLVNEWARQRLWDIRAGNKPQSDISMVEEAFRCAENMIEWRRANDGTWRNPAAV